MKKLLQRYELILPTIAVVMGIYLVNVTEEALRITGQIGRGDIFVYRFFSGWNLMVLAYIGIFAYLMFCFYGNKQLEYMYSFPVTKGQLFWRSTGEIHGSLIIAGIVYGLFFAIKCRQFSPQDTTSDIAVCVVVNVTWFYAQCLLAEWIMLITRRIVVGVFLSVISVFYGVSLLVGTFGYLLQCFAHGLRQNYLWMQMMYRGIRLPWRMYLNHYGIRETQDAFHMTGDNYMMHMVIMALSLTVISGLLCWACVCMVRRCNLTQGTFFRLKVKEAYVLGTFLLTMIFANGLSNMVMHGVVHKKSQEVTTLLLEFVRRKSMEFSGGSRIYYLPWTRALVILVASATSAFLILYGAGYLRRKIYEKNASA